MERRYTSCSLDARQSWHCLALGNDAHNTALGEKMYGGAHGMKNFIVLNLGVGLGSCFFSEGHEHQGASGYAGEFGHTIIIDNGRPCPCGLKGCLETYVAVAIEVFRRTGYMLGWGLSYYAMLVNPEAIIITGGVSHAGHWLMDPTHESFENHVFLNMRGKVRLMLSDLNDAERDVLGASALAWEVPEYSLFK